MRILSWLDKQNISPNIVAESDANKDRTFITSIYKSIAYFIMGRYQKQKSLYRNVEAFSSVNRILF